MLNTKILSLMLALCLLLVSLPLMAQTEVSKKPLESVPKLLLKANNTFAEKDYVGFRDAMMRLRELRPNNSDYMYQMVIAHALMDEKTPAYDVMLQMQKQGLSYDFTLSETTANIRGTQVFDYLNDLMVLAGDPMGDAELVFTLPESVTMPESITWDNSRGKFLVGTQSDGRILAVGMNGEVTELIKANNENGLWAVMDLLVDEENNRLWVTSAALPGFSGFEPANKGRSALFEFDLKSLELLDRHPVPVDGQAHILGSMVLSPAGDIFIVDRNLQLLYRKLANEDKLKVMLGLRKMVSMRGIAMNDDGSLIYIADREMGIAVIEVKSGRAMPLQVDATLNLGGIDGLYFKDNALVMIQNGIKPQRVMLLQLDPVGIQVTGVVPMAVAQTEFDYPTYGTIRGGELYYFANSHWAGSPKPYKAVSVLRSPLNSDKELVQPDMRRFLERQSKAQELKVEEKEQQ